MKLALILMALKGIIAENNSTQTQPSVPQNSPVNNPPQPTQVQVAPNNPVANPTNNPTNQNTPQQTQQPVNTKGAPQVTAVVVVQSNTLGQYFTYTNYITYYPAATPSGNGTSIAENSSSSNNTTFIIIVAFVAFGILALAGIVFGVRMYVKSKDNERDFNEIFKMANNGHSSTPRIVALEKGVNSPALTSGVVTEEMYFPTTAGVSGNNGTVYRNNSQQRSPMYGQDGYYDDYQAYRAYEYDAATNYYFDPHYVAVPTVQVAQHNSEDSLLSDPKIIDSYQSDDEGLKPGYPTSIFDQYEQQKRHSD
ncbi:hypothetical protein HDV01_004598 [Terramyces sp. JEL0728]|nr:hypothetical protein HDV01_004598 [Terramyces sp. JEL0728]